MKRKSITLVAFLLAVTAGANDFPQGWRYRMPITVSHSYIDATLTDWTLVVNQTCGSAITNTLLNPASVAAARADGGDIRFSSDPSGGNRLACDIRTWTAHETDGGRKMEIAVKIPSVSHTTNTTIYMWWGNSGVEQPASTNGYGQYSAYDGHHVLVAPCGSVLDRTSNQWARTVYNVTAGNVEGKLGFATKYGGNASGVYGEIADATAWSTILKHNTSFTLECMAATDDPDAIQMLMSKNKGHTDYRGVVLYYHGVEKQFALSVHETHNGPIRIVKFQDHSPTAGRFYHYSAAYDGSNGSDGIALYIDGLAQVGASVANDGTVTNTDHGDTFKVGARTWGLPNRREWDGAIDEARVSTVARSAAWIKANYNNAFAMADMVDVGAIEEKRPTTIMIR